MGLLGGPAELEEGEHCLQWRGPWAGELDGSLAPVGLFLGLPLPLGLGRGAGPSIISARLMSTELALSSDGGSSSAVASGSKGLASATASSSSMGGPAPSQGSELLAAISNLNQSLVKLRRTGTL